MQMMTTTEARRARAAHELARVQATAVPRTARRRKAREAVIWQLVRDIRALDGAMTVQTLND